MVSRHKTIKIILLTIVSLFAIYGAISFGQNTYRRYLAPKEYDQRRTQETYDDIAKRLDTLERGR